MTSPAVAAEKPPVQSTWVPLDLIDDSDRIRPVEPAWAEVMADDLSRGAELPAVVLRPAQPPEIGETFRFALVIGGHRMEAHRLAGRKVIRADIEEMTRAEARIREVDENLKRHELNPLDRALMLLARKRAWEEVYPETVNGGDAKYKENLRNSRSQTLRSDQPGRFSAEAADKVGLSERSVQAAIELAVKLAPGAIGLLRTTGLVHNAAELKRLAEHPANDQVVIAGALANGDARSVEQARVTLGMTAQVERDPDEQVFNRLVELWSRANIRTKRRFKAHAGLALGNSREGAR